MTIPDEAVQAAWVAHDNMLGYSKLERHRAALTAALPFLTGAPSPRAQALEEAIATVRAKGERIKKEANAFQDVGASLEATIRIKVCDEIRALSSQPVSDGRKFKLGDRLTKNKGSSWTGLVVGFYSTELTPIGYAIESETEKGSVQIYPETALRPLPASPGASE